MRDDLQRYACELADVVQSMPFRAVAAAAEMLLACHRR